MINAAACLRRFATTTLPIRLAITLGLAAATPLAEAQTRTACAERTSVVARLADRYGETLQSIGLQSNSAVVEVYASVDTGTWTILMTRPDGISCLIASGESWQKDVAEAPGSDA